MNERQIDQLISESKSRIAEYVKQNRLEAYRLYNMTDPGLPLTVYLCL